MQPHNFVLSDIGEWFDEFTRSVCGQVRVYSAEDLMSIEKANKLGPPCQELEVTKEL